MRRKRLFFDVDDVMVAFAETVINRANEKFGTLFSKEDCHCHDIERAFNKPEIATMWKDLVKQGGFIRSLPAIDGAIKTLNMVQDQIGDVYPLTASPFIENWAYERAEWLIQVANIPFKRHIQTVSKFVTRGDCFVDDKLSNLEEFKAENPNSLIIVFDQPWNRCSNEFIRAYGWDHLFELLKKL